MSQKQRSETIGQQCSSSHFECTPVATARCRLARNVYACIIEAMSMSSILHHFACPMAGGSKQLFGNLKAKTRCTQSLTAHKAHATLSKLLILMACRSHPS
jgi:hypothetical protein